MPSPGVGEEGDIPVSGQWGKEDISSVGARRVRRKKGGDRGRVPRNIFIQEENVAGYCLKFEVLNIMPYLFYQQRVSVDCGCERTEGCVMYQERCPLGTDALIALCRPCS